MAALHQQAAGRRAALRRPATATDDTAIRLVFPGSEVIAPSAVAGLASPRGARADAARHLWPAGLPVSYALVGGACGGWRETQQAIVRESIARWQEAGARIGFVEVADPAAALVRIGNVTGAGNWSWLGATALDARSDLTANLDIDCTTAEGRVAAMQLIGHIIGMRPAVPEASLPGWDPQSIMQVAPQGLRRSGIAANESLSAGDQRWLQACYGQPVPLGTVRRGDILMLPGDGPDQIDADIDGPLSGKCRIAVYPPIDARLFAVERRAAGADRIIAWAESKGLKTPLSVEFRPDPDARYRLTLRSWYRPADAFAQLHVS